MKPAEQWLKEMRVRFGTTVMVRSDSNFEVDLLDLIKQIQIDAIESAPTPSMTELLPPWAFQPID